ncbi:hypothetical protein IKF25_00940 [Candidatus Saccharibacteria bacterium]|nr:hypothetical protein [Candidatus Saccharibacteria bacterium]
MPMGPSGPGGPGGFGGGHGHGGPYGGGHGFGGAHGPMGPMGPMGHMGMMMTFSALNTGTGTKSVNPGENHPTVTEKKAKKKRTLGQRIKEKLLDLYAQLD